MLFFAGTPALRTTQQLPVGLRGPLGRGYMGGTGPFQTTQLIPIGNLSGAG